MVAKVRVFLLAAALVAVTPGNARAWNPWDNLVRPAVEGAGRAVSEVGKFVGGVVGAPFGGFLGSATKPTVDNIEAAGQRLIGQVDAVMSNQLTKLDQIATKQIANIDLTLEKRIAQFDQSLQARIADVDSTLASRIEQVNGVLTSSIAQVDQSLKDRLDQLDEIAVTRIGTLDVVATKAALTFEQGLIRVIGAACILIFVAAALWIVYRQYATARAAKPNDSWSHVALSRWRPMAGQALGAAAAVGCLFLLVYLLPGSARGTASSLSSEQDAAYDRAMAAMDFQQARFHAALMQAMNSTDTESRARFLKAELLRDLFSRAGVLSTVSGLSTVVLRVNQIESLAEEDGPDPDLNVVKAFILWQSGATKNAEAEAARLCVEALARAGDDPSFALRPLAINYILNYGARPIPAATQPNVAVAEKDRSDFQKALEANAITPLTYVFRYNSHVRELEQAVSSAYVRMMEAHGEVMAAAKLNDKEWRAGALQARTAQAAATVAAWDGFIAKINTDPLIAESPASLAAFLLNDATYLRAAWYLADKDGTKSGAAGALGTAPAMENIDGGIRAQVPRVRFSGRLAMLATPTRVLVDSEEYRRFRSFEGALTSFENAHTQFLLALHEGGRQNPAAPATVVKAATDAAIKAAQGQIWNGGRLYAESIAERVKALGQAYWVQQQWQPVDAAKTAALRERSLKLM